jgi:hypothetical protein
MNMSLSDLLWAQLQRFQDAARNFSKAGLKFTRIIFLGQYQTSHCEVKALDIFVLCHVPHNIQQEA